MKKLISIVLVVALLGFLSYQFLFKKDDEKYLEKGVEYFNENRYDEALVYFDLSEKFGNNKALKYSSAIYLEKGKPDLAIPKLQKYISTTKDPEDLKFCYNDLGVAYFKLNDLTNAKKYWKKGDSLGNETSRNNLKELEKTK
ncbi:hypothetical protein [Soonwooa sp.]|uniref:tetratricopeptide repeat protein n=1 Tax=Soonwooa sp. TaxID=1938592 RepID=UPI00260D241F|nr:hypothetical protein [Soonwooa sp.]